MQTYLETIQAGLRKGQASEHTRRPALKALLEAVHDGITASTATRQMTVCGKPDMVVWRGPVVQGYVKTTDVAVELTAVAQSEQLQRYRAGLPNLLLTNPEKRCPWADSTIW